MQLETTNYCEKFVREHDPDRYVISLTYPAKIRAVLWPLFAFNHEIAKTREVVSETQLGLIRLQWWRDGIGEVYDGKQVREHPVLLALETVIKEYDLPQECFNKLIYAREFDLEDVPPASIEGLINYADFTHTPLLRLVLKILGTDVDVNNIKKTAVFYSLIGLIRSLPVHLRQQRCYLPADRMEHHGVTQWNLFNGNGHDKVPEIIKET